jgi:hypothetical protein
MARKQKQEKVAEAQVAIVEEPVKEQTTKRGNSSVQSPVSFVWVTCLNAMAAAAAAGEAPPSRKALVTTCIDAGVAYYTARTQVQAYLKASNNGAELPAKLPRGVAIK